MDEDKTTIEQALENVDTKKYSFWRHGMMYNQRCFANDMCKEALRLFVEEIEKIARKKQIEKEDVDIVITKEEWEQLKKQEGVNEK